MPYTIITHRPTGRQVQEGTVCAVAARTTVATLDEAREHIGPLLAEALPYGPAGNRMALRDLAESGGTIGPLPDGTVIEVRQSREQARV